MSLDNVHVLEDGTLAIFDFENCGLGWRAADICGARQGLVWPEFLEGYLERRPLSQADLTAIDWFVIPFAVDNLRWHLDVKGSYQGTEVVGEQIDLTLEHLRRWAASALRPSGTVRPSRPIWIVDEERHAGAEHLDVAYAARYDRKAQHDPTSDIELLRRRGLNTESVVVDFGAGTGSFAVAVAEHCSKVIADEPSAAMLSMLVEKAAAAGVNNLVPMQAGVLSYRHEGPLADFVYSRTSTICRTSGKPSH